MKVLQILSLSRDDNVLCVETKKGHPNFRNFPRLVFKIPSAILSLSRDTNLLMNQKRTSFRETEYHLGIKFNCTYLTTSSWRKKFSKFKMKIGCHYVESLYLHCAISRNFIGCIGSGGWIMNSWGEPVLHDIAICATAMRKRDRAPHRISSFKIAKCRMT